MLRSLRDVRRRLVEAMRADPPFRLAALGDGGPILDRWMVRRLSPADLQLLQRLEALYGAAALAELFADALLEAGVVRPFSVN